MIYTKRTEGKLKGCLNLRDSYNHYKMNSKNPVKFKIYSKYIKECNLELLNQIVNNSNELELPYRMGRLFIVKNERSYNKNKDKWAIDFKRTKEEGFIVYFDQKYIYNWYWDKRNAIIINKSKYKFIAIRKAKRMVASALKRGQDYFKIK